MTDMDGDPIRPDPHSDDWYDGYGACQREHAAQPVAGEFDVVDMPDGYKSIVAAQPAAGEVANPVAPLDVELLAAAREMVAAEDAFSAAIDFERDTTKAVAAAARQTKALERLRAAAQPDTAGEPGE